MPDREKIIRGLECLITNEVDCDGCPYNEGENSSCLRNIAKDALELLKEQKPETTDYIWTCPYCDGQLIIKAKKVNKVYGTSFDVCPVCGKRLLYGKAD